MEDTITSDDILGKQAIGPNGSILGVVVKLHIHKQNKQITGITIDQGFMKPDLFVGLEFIRNFGVDTVFLSRMPFNKYIGMQILTADGNSLGHVRDFVIEHKKIKEFVISNRISKHTKYIPAKAVHTIGGSIILKANYKE
ncbi:PRC-barrel domain-containing protein [Candidatus Woesearchaeota archaeon]|nr:PRC-barrel domain-containing protein [Candidatus Woesearchaeota archaeon]